MIKELMIAAIENLQERARKSMAEVDESIASLKAMPTEFEPELASDLILRFKKIRSNYIEGIKDLEGYKRSLDGF